MVVFDTAFDVPPTDKRYFAVFFLRPKPDGTSAIDGILDYVVNASPMLLAFTR